jgi:FkbM family methyltransferase
MIFSKSPNKNEAKEILKQIINLNSNISLRRINKPFAIYGAGNLGKMAIEYFKIIGKTPELIIDKSFLSEDSSNEFESIKKCTLNEVSTNVRKNYLIIVTIVNSAYSEIRDLLQVQGYNDIVPFYDVTEAYKDVHPLSNGWHLNNFNSSDYEKTSTVLSNWDDDISRAHHLQFIAWHRLREDWIFEDSNVDTNNRYFLNNSIYTLNDSERFLDVGAHKGEVTQKFINNTKNKFQKIWLIESDNFNFNEINNLFKNDGSINPKITLINKAVSAINSKQLFFEGLGYASQFSTFGNKELNTISIDELSLNPTFIKMHLEGWELEALKGAINTILLHKPILAITCYHNSQGVWELPLWLMNIKYKDSTFYKYLFRLHGWCGTGGVIYCIPNR